MNGATGFSIAFILIGAIGFALGSVYGAERGMVWVASGQYKCQLETVNDLTTEWVCGKARENKDESH